MKKLVDLMEKAKQSPRHLWWLNVVLTRAIPFNKPHGFKVSAVGDDFIETSAKYCKKNFNHIRGIHACGIATIAEMSAGLLLMKQFNLKKYRLILSELKIEYHYQAKQDITSRSQLTADVVNELQQRLADEDAVLQTVVSEIHDVAGNHVATTHTTWQIKEWSKVKTKR